MHFLFSSINFSSQLFFCTWVLPEEKRCVRSCVWNLDALAHACCVFVCLGSFISGTVEWFCADRKLRNRNRKLLWLLICLMICRSRNVFLWSGSGRRETTHTHGLVLWGCCVRNCCTVSSQGLKAQSGWGHVFAVCLRLDGGLRGRTVMSALYLLTGHHSCCTFPQTLM